MRSREVSRHHAGEMEVIGDTPGSETCPAYQRRELALAVAATQAAMGGVDPQGAEVAERGLARHPAGRRCSTATRR